MPLAGSRAAEALVGYRGNAPALARRQKPHAPFAESLIPPKQLILPQRNERYLP